MRIVKGGPARIVVQRRPGLLWPGAAASARVLRAGTDESIVEVVEPDGRFGNAGSYCAPCIEAWLRTGELRPPAGLRYDVRRNRSVRPGGAGTSDEVDPDRITNGRIDVVRAATATRPSRGRGSSGSPDAARSCEGSGRCRKPGR